MLIVPTSKLSPLTANIKAVSPLAFWEFTLAEIMRREGDREGILESRKRERVCVYASK